MPENGVPEPNLYVDWVAGISDCGSNCKNLILNTVECVADGSLIYEYETAPCDAIPPPPPPDCEPTDHGQDKEGNDIPNGEGVAGFEFECGDGIDNDCDLMPDCQEARCRPTHYCSDACDLDGDQVDNPSCGGSDCDEQSTYRSSIPIKDSNGNLLQETNSFDCNDQRDNDCDGAIDYPNDSSCPAPTPTPTPTPTPEENPEPTPEITPDPCGGDECCGRGTHTECTEGYCDPSVEVCSDVDPYDNIPPVCETQPGECEPEQCVEVCN